MANPPTRNVTLPAGKCPACGTDLLLVVDLVPDALSDPVVLEPRVTHWENLGAMAIPQHEPGRVNLEARITGLSVTHRCGTRAEPQS